MRHELDKLLFAPELLTPNCKSNETVLNRDHWLHDNIVWYARLGDNATELVSNAPMTLRGDADFNGVTDHGDALETLDSIDNAAYCPGTPELYQITNEITVVWAGEIDAHVNFMGLVSVPYQTGSWSSPYLSFGLSATNVAGQVKIHYSVGGANSTATLPGSSYLKIDGSLYIYSASMSIVSGSATARFYRNGEFIGSVTPSTAGVIAWNTENDVVVNCSDRYGNDVSGIKGRANVAFIADRFCDDGEHFELASNLYDTLMPANAGIWVPEGVTVTNINVSDTGNGNDDLAIAVGLAVNDVGTGNDLDPGADVALSITDAGTGNDNTNQGVQLSVNDTASGSDDLAIAAALAISDAGTGADTLSILAAVLKTVTDSATGADSVTLSVSVPITDLGTGNDQVNIAALLSIIDNAQGTDIIIKTQPGQGQGVALITFALSTRSMSFGLASRSMQFDLKQRTATYTLQ